MAEHFLNLIKPQTLQIQNLNELQAQEKWRKLYQGTS